MITTMSNHNIGGQTLDDSIRQKEQEKLMFHDFLGPKTSALSSKATAHPRLLPEKAAAGAASTASASSGGLSSTSDLVHGGNHLEGIHLFGPRSEISGSSMSNRLAGSKRSNSDSLFSSQESPESLHLAKMLRNGIRSPSTNANPLVSYPVRGGHINHLLHLSSSRFKDETSAPSLISHSAADEGSRTGMKGPVISSSLNLERTSSGVTPNASKFEPFSPSSSCGWKDLTTCTRQMTIFYGGQAHVFDDVHPNKADVIMALAGSNGGSWSTGFSPKQKGKHTGDDAYKRGQPCIGGSSRGGASASCNQIFTPPAPGGGHQGSIIPRGRGQDNADPVRASDTGNADKLFRNLSQHHEKGN
ncbi:PREDICTED: protein TIFY 8 isoform X2 [Tarenaya hassleriana]|uniref:protein TIFY 8 isoform X2 n=1 Tax=Tarenaya hassleriana TaxID=28532 RepID=UPI0008FCEB71|nr:PREDICTED: protein TIFY 8 isoform X2 [Tarenaya hassleriana]